MRNALRETRLYPVAEIHLSAWLLNEQARPLPDEELWSYAIEQTSVLRARVITTVGEFAGARGQLTVLDVRILRGSVEVIIALGAAFELIAKWKDFVDGLELLSKQLSAVLEGFFAPRVRGRQFAVESRVLVVPNRLPTQPTGGAGSSRDPFVTYLAATNAVMLAVIIGLLLLTLATR